MYIYIWYVYVYIYTTPMYIYIILYYIIYYRLMKLSCGGHPGPPKLFRSHPPSQPKLRHLEMQWLQAFQGEPCCFICHCLGKWEWDMFGITRNSVGLMNLMIPIFAKEQLFAHMINLFLSSAHNDFSPWYSHLAAFQLRRQPTVCSWQLPLPGDISFW